MDTSMVASGNHKLLDSDDELAEESTVQVVWFKIDNFTDVNVIV